MTASEQQAREIAKIYVDALDQLAQSDKAQEFTNDEAKEAAVNLFLEKIDLVKFIDISARYLASDRFQSSLTGMSNSSMTPEKLKEIKDSCADSNLIMWNGAKNTILSFT